jgi:hypothetical protein
MKLAPVTSAEVESKEDGTVISLVERLKCPASNTTNTVAVIDAVDLENWEYILCPTAECHEKVNVQPITGSSPCSSNTSGKWKCGVRQSAFLPLHGVHVTTCHFRRNTGRQVVPVGRRLSYQKSVLNFSPFGVASECDEPVGTTVMADVGCDALSFVRGTN